MMFASKENMDKTYSLIATKKDWAILQQKLEALEDADLVGFKNILSWIVTGSLK
jgi:hypothetical protein